MIEDNNNNSINCGDVKNVVIIGTGLMGTGIAQVSIEGGFRVQMVGRSVEKCTQALHKITAGVQKSAKRRFPTDAEAQKSFVDSTSANLEFQTNVFDVDLNSVDIVIEAIVENMKVKQKLFADLEPKLRGDCLLVTNTSSFLLKDVCSKMNNVESFGGLHFFNPVPAMKLVEVIRGDETSQQAYNALCRFCVQIGKTPVKCKDSPGFIVNRLLVPYLADAMRLHESGDADIKDIDTAMRLGTGYPMGPFELMDYIGLDTMKFIIDGWHQRHPDDHRFVPCASLDQLVVNGKMGRKNGEGFYRYGEK